MRHDSLFGEPVLWSGRPKEVSTPPLYCVAALVCAVTSAIATASAVGVATGFGARPGSLLFLAGWMACMAVAFSLVPRWWQSGLEFFVTERHILLQRGRLRRHIDRCEISFARIHWHPRAVGVGDLELVRAVPTGALRRRLSIVLHGLLAPDRVWAIMRGVMPTSAEGIGPRLLAQRLDDGETVLWSARPSAWWRQGIPSDARTTGSILLALLLAVVTVVVAVHAVHALGEILKGGLTPRSTSFIALATSLALCVCLMTSVVAGILYAVLIRPVRRSRRTRYFITDRRVLIQRENDELHINRTRIVDVIDSSGWAGCTTSSWYWMDRERARSPPAGRSVSAAVVDSNPCLGALLTPTPP